MSVIYLKRVHGMGGLCVERKLAPYAKVSGVMHIDLSLLNKTRVSAIVTSLKRGFSRGNTGSEQYLIYSLLCQKFGIKHAKISNGRYNWIPLPDNTEEDTFRKKVMDILEPMHQLTGEKYHHWYTGYSNILGQRSLTINRPPKVPMKVLGKAMMSLIPEPDFAAQCAAIDFVKNGGVITQEF